MQKLSDSQITTSLEDLPGWTVQDGRLIRDYRFATFADAMIFVNKVAELAEEQDHHPDIDIRYNRITLGLYTHDTAGITRRDFKLAAALSGLAT